jgi:hypothetical protein
MWSRLEPFRGFKQTARSSGRLAVDAAQTTQITWGCVKRLRATERQSEPGHIQFPDEPSRDLSRASPHLVGMMLGGNLFGESPQDCAAPGSKSIGTVDCALLSHDDGGRFMAFGGRSRGVESVALADDLGCFGG